MQVLNAVLDMATTTSLDSNLGKYMKYDPINPIAISRTFN